MVGPEDLDFVYQSIMELMHIHNWKFSSNRVRRMHFAGRVESLVTLSCRRFRRFGRQKIEMPEFSNPFVDIAM